MESERLSDRERIAERCLMCSIKKTSGNHPYRYIFNDTGYAVSNDAVLRNRAY